MSKQATLFKAWGRGNEKSRPKPNNAGINKFPVANHFPPKSKSKATAPRHRGACNSASTVAESTEEYGFEEFEELDDFFDDDVAEELAIQATYSLPPSSPFSVLNCSAIEQIPGFDPSAGEIWIYPTNYPVRDYQFNIVQKALFRNTLVCLPTGLGKTFIAAVVMYNFYRWYPSGKIVFLAPTKPLVAQQIEACHNIMGIPQEHSAEMTGQLSPKERNILWISGRVFFLTPQVMQNDLARGACPAQDVCCVVFDEAHKALGNHSYCQVIRELSSAGSSFRVLALSATPGNDLKAVQQVVTNLQVGQIELRSEDSFDIQRYVHQRKVEKMVVPLEGEILDIKTSFLGVLCGVVGRLSKHRLLYHSNAEKMSKFQILQARDQFRSAGSVPPPGVHIGAVEGDFALAISLYHAYELLELHGMRSFYQFLNQSFYGGDGGQSRARMELLRSHDFKQILRSLEEKVGSGSQPDASRALQSPRAFFYSHPKLRKLEEVVLSHFKNFQGQSSSSSHAHSSSGPSLSSVNTRVMIFSQYRESVQEIAEMLSQQAPLIRVMSFVGHGSSGKSSSKGLTQREQTEVVRKFREGGYNTLVATCVGEEGLDIGEVDLIVCFDAHKSPIRLVQRMGRTGRKRAGRIVVIVAQGKEEQIYLKSQSNKTSIHRAIRDGCKSLSFYPNSPRMVPTHLHPQVHRMHMSIKEFVGTSSKAGRRGKGEGHTKGKLAQHRLRFEPKGGNKGAYLSDAELAYWSENYALSDRESRALERAVERSLSRDTPMLSIKKLTGTDMTPATEQNSSFLGNTSLNSSTLQGKFSLALDKWVHWQTAPIPHRTIGHSLRTEQLTSSLEFMDLLHTNEDLGQSYELEMKSFLDPDDVKMAPDRRSKSPLECSEEQEVRGGGKGRRVIRRRQRILDDSSDDDDFRSSNTSSKPADKPSRLQQETPGRIGTGNSTPETVDVIDLGTPPPNDTCMVNSSENDKVFQGTHPVLSPVLAADPQTAVIGDNGRDYITASQHVIPKAPSADSLDWIDLIEPSQVSTPKVPLRTIKPDGPLCSRPSPARANHQTTELKDFHFATPRAPPSTSKRGKVLALPNSTPNPPIPQESTADATSTLSLFSSYTSPPPSNYSGIDLFVLEEFSDMSWQDNGKPQEEEPHGGTGKENQATTGEQGTRPLTSEDGGYNFDGLGDLKALELDKGLDPNVTVIEESDLEDAGTREEGLREEDEDNDEMLFLPGKSSAATSTSAGHGDQTAAIPSEPSEDSFLEVHGKRKASRRGRGFLDESPAHHPTIGTSVTKPGSSAVSPGINENSAADLNRTTPSRVKDKEMEAQWLGRRRKLHSRGQKRKSSVRFNFDSSDDEFQEPLLTRLRKKKTSGCCPPASKVPKLDKPVSGATAGKEGERPQPGRKERHVGFLEEEAEQTEESRDGSSSEDTDEERDYDFEDSFINDATMLTQFSPSQRCANPSRKNVPKPPISMADVYRRSLMSPDNLFAGKQRGCGSRYRMVFSQRHQLLDHYVRKAGFHMASGSKRPWRKRSPGAKLKGSEVNLLAPSDAALFASTSSEDSSEAEEVLVKYGDEDLQELPNSQSFEREEEDEEGRERLDLAQSSHDGGAVLRSDSDGDSELSQHGTTPVQSSNHRRRKLKLSSSSATVEESPGAGTPEGPHWLSPDAGIPERPPGSCHGDSTSRTPLGSARGSSSQEVISASLLASIQPHSTPAEFSLGMDSWLSDSGGENMDSEPPLQGAGEARVMEEPSTSGAERPEQGASGGSPEEDFTDVLASLDFPLTREEIEVNFGHTAGDTTDNEIHGGTHECGSSSMEPSETGLLPADTTGSKCRPNTTRVQPPSSSLSHCSTRGGTILTSSRNIAHSQVVSMLRYRHHMDVIVCPLGHTGYVVSNRMMVERRMHSDFSTSTAGGKIFTKLQEARELYNKVCLVLEKDPVRVGMKKPVAKPGHYLERGLARVVAADVVVLFSQSQEDTASLLAKLVEAERRKGHAITVTEDLQDQIQPVLQLLLKVPRINYITALNLCATFRTLHELTNCSPEDLQTRVPSVHSSQAQRICDFFHHQFDSNLVG